MIKQEEVDKLQALSRQTGLSMETLRLIKKVEDKVTERKQETTKIIDEQMDKQLEQSLCSLASSIRYIFQMHRTGTLQMHLLVEQLNDKQQNGEFVDRQERQRQIEELARMVPRWIQVRFMPSHGKIVKCNNQALSQFQVNQIIHQKTMAT